MGVPCGDVWGCQAGGQSGEQELEQLVLKLSVLKDFLAGIEKKVGPGGVPLWGVCAGGMAGGGQRNCLGDTGGLHGGGW